MLSTKKGIVLALFLGLAWVGSAFAEQSYLLYPTVPTVFRYDVNRYELVSAGESKFNSSYAVGNLMLWDRIEQRIPYEIYETPQLIGFEPTTGTSEFIVYTEEFDVVIDGFGDAQRTLGNLCLRFYPYSAVTNPSLTVDGVASDRLLVHLDPLDVVTPLGNGFYSDTSLHHIVWSGATAMEIVAFSDKDGDGMFEGTPAYRIVTHYAPVATQATTWGSVKALYRK
ncbi:MAG TPA: hypothetical protein VFH88_09035 [Candidatus Krumholzibacteria bacterium]|nr:hypothetical protein [Candidatus Krumholzibacteria bacterium]